MCGGGGQNSASYSSTEELLLKKRDLLLARRSIQVVKVMATSKCVYRVLWFKKKNTKKYYLPSSHKIHLIQYEISASPRTSAHGVSFGFFFFVFANFK